MDYCYRVGCSGSLLLFFFSGGDDDLHAVLKKKELLVGTVDSASGIVTWLATYLSLSTDLPDLPDLPRYLLTDLPYVLNVIYFVMSGLAQVIELPHQLTRQVTKPPTHQTAKSPSHQVTGLLSYQLTSYQVTNCYQVTKLPSCQTAKSCHQLTKSPNCQVSYQILSYRPGYYLDRLSGCQSS